MAKYQNDTMLDAALSTIKTGVDLMTVCITQPATYNSAVAQGSAMLAQVTMSTNLFQLADGDTNGRKLTVSAVSGLIVSATGTATHIALVNTTTSTLWYVTTCSAQVLTAGNTLAISGWDVELADSA